MYIVNITGNMFKANCNNRL